MQEKQEYHRCITQIDVKGQTVACLELLGSISTYQVLATIRVLLLVTNPTPPLDWQKEVEAQWKS